MVSSARGLPAEFGEPTVLWDIRTGTRQYTTPTIDRGCLYLGVNDIALDRPGVRPTGGGVLMCVEQATGKLVWQMPSPRNFGGKVPPFHFNHWRCGFCFGPVVAGERVYVVGGRGEVLCLDRQGQLNGNDGPFTNELAYVAIGQSPVHGEGRGRLCCVDGATGKEIWASTDVKRTLSTVSIADGLLYIMDYSGNLHCFDSAPLRSG